jgi:murein L,D-transpeptidase YcbB/YkuD
VTLDKPVPVLIPYGAAIVIENGEVCFFDDGYEQDAPLSDP